MLAGFTPNGKAAGCIGARRKTALHGPADGGILLLNAIACLDAGNVARTRGFRNIGEVEIKNDIRVIDATRDDQIRVHCALVAVDHEVRIDPVIESLAAGCDGTGLQAETLADLDSVVGVIENAVEALMKVRHVVATVEIVIDEDFPVAFEMVQPPLESVKTRSVKGGNRVKSSATRFQPDEYPFLPDGNIHRQKAHRPAVEIHNGAHIGCAFQLTFERVGPAVVRAS